MKFRLTPYFLIALTVSVSLACQKAPEKVEKKPEKVSSESSLRIASLSPAITETTLELGGEKKLVAVSDYCPKQLDLPRIGSTFAPRLEAIYRAHPTHILTTETLSTDNAELKKLNATFVALPWLSTKEVAESTRQLGKFLSLETEARVLADRFEKALSPRSPEGAPRVLLLLGDSDQGNAVYYFIKPGTVHDDLLQAAGGKNAIPKFTPGVPEISAERILELDPDAVVFIADERVRAAAVARKQALSELTPLRAVRQGHVAVFSAPSLLSTGPHLAGAVPLLKNALTALLADSVEKKP